jgi:hypothetical protein
MDNCDSVIKGDNERIVVQSTSEANESTSSLGLGEMQNLGIKEFEKIGRGVVYCEMQAREWSESDRLDHALRLGSFPPLGNLSCYRWECGGLTKDICRLTRDQVAQYHSIYYQPENAVILLCGGGEEFWSFDFNSILDSVQFNLPLTDYGIEGLEKSLENNPIIENEHFISSKDLLANVELKASQAGIANRLESLGSGRTIVDHVAIDSNGTDCNEAVAIKSFLAEKKGDFVAQFKYTIAVRKEGPLIICGNTIDLSKYSSQYKVTDENVVKSLEVPLDTFLPNSKKTTKKQKKDNKEKKKKKKEAKLRKKEEARKKKEEEA